MITIRFYDTLRRFTTSERLFPEDIRHEPNLYFAIGPFSKDFSILTPSTRVRSFVYTKKKINPE